MMHRLQFEEAQQSSYAITPARAGGEIRDESESESLAVEFQSLLAQLSGQITAIPDQATAVSIALAQTVAPERLKSAEKAPIEQNASADDGQGEQIGGEARPSTDGFVSDFVDSRAENGEERKTTVRRTVDTDIAEDVVLATSTLNDTPVLVQETAQIIDQQVLQEVAKFVSNEVNKDVSTAQVQLFQEIVDDSSEPQVLADTPSNQAGDKKVDSDLLHDEASRVTTVAHQGTEKNIKDEEISADALLPSVAPQIENRQKNEEIRKGSNNHSQVKQTGEENILTLDTQEFTASDQQGGQHRLNYESGERRSQNFDDALFGQRQRMTEIDKKIVVQEKDSALIQAPEFVTALETRREGLRPDNAIQMALLRQAFESMRSARIDGSDSTRMRQQAQSIQSTGAASEAKSNQGEGSSRSKSITRPQIGRMLERVEATLKEAARGRDGKTISLHLEPVDLGKVKVDVSLREGTLHARISPDNQQVAQALRDHAHELQGALRKLGLEVDSVSVSITLDEFGREMNTGQQTMDGRSFQDERNNLPFDKSQLAENTIGNELALRSKAGADSERLGAGSVADHWIA